MECGGDDGGNDDLSFNALSEECLDTRVVAVATQEMVHSNATKTVRSYTATVAIEKNDPATSSHNVVRNGTAQNAIAIGACPRHGPRRKQQRVRAIVRFAPHVLLCGSTSKEPKVSYAILMPPVDRLFTAGGGAMVTETWAWAGNDSPVDEDEDAAGVEPLLCQGQLGFVSAAPKIDPSEGKNTDSPMSDHASACFTV